MCRKLLALVSVAFTLLSAPAAVAAELTVWCAYTGREEQGLRRALETFARARGVELRLLSIPFGAYASKLEAAIPTGNGPDLFIDAHERLPAFVARDLIQPWPASIATELYLPGSVAALRFEGQLYGLPLSVKSLALYVNEALVGAGRLTTIDELKALQPVLPRGVYPLVFETENPYYAVTVLHAHGGELLTGAGEYGLSGPSAQRALTTLRAWTGSGLVPEAPTGDLVKRLFVSGQAAAAISGPWLAADLPPELRVRVEPLPRLSGSSSAALEAYSTVEGAYVARRARQPALARELLSYIAQGQGARIRRELGRQVVAARLPPASDPIVRALSEAAARGRPMPVHPTMRAVWEPAARALQSALRARATPEIALASSAEQFGRTTRPEPASSDPLWGVIFLGIVGLSAAFAGVRALGDAALRRRIARSGRAYAYLGHSALAVLLLVVLPLLVGFATSFFSGSGSTFRYVGLGNYLDILWGSGGAPLGSGSFWFVLLVTVLWTVTNIVCHVLFGAALALLLARPRLWGSRFYRVLLILPWAVPSYVTALTWKGMFHRQFGAINAILAALGLEPIDWFSRWLTAFSANLLTNVWLGFPFMMVVTLGALTVVSKEVYEAAAVDGATGWQRLRHVTLPLIRPTLTPAVVLGAAWTFNLFNVVFLVSGGEPAGTTEILVSEAYRWAFTRSAQYGYAAAYAVLIFGVLLLLTRSVGQRRWAAEAA